MRLVDPDRIRTARNASFGELYAHGGGSVPLWAEVAEHKSEYSRGEVPPGVVVLVCTVDIQKNEIIWCVRGWGARASSWLVDFGTLHGPTTSTEVWDSLADVIQQPIGGKHIKLVLIDSGFRPGKPTELPENRVYQFAYRFPRHVICCKGSSIPRRVPLTKSRIEVTLSGKAAKAGINQLMLDTDHWKSWVHERIRWSNDEPGGWHLPRDVPNDFCKQIVSEARIKLASGRVQWKQTSRENHFLDLEAMQAAASHLLNAARHTGRGTATPAPTPPVEEVADGVLPPTPPIPGGILDSSANAPWRYRPTGGWMSRPNRPNPWDR